MKAIINGRLILKDRIVDNKALIFDEKIVGIKDDIHEFSGLEIIDAKGCYVSPGFIDIHLHGAFGYDVLDGDSSSLDKICQGLPERGVTGFLPTTISMPWDKINRALTNIRNHTEKQAIGATVLGAHLEGPFINPVRKGAHDESHIMKPDYEKIKDYLDVIRIITIAPEIDENMSFIKGLGHNKDVALSIGHSDATYEEAMEAIDAGIKSVTHLYNAMSGLSHRSPGVPGAALNSDVYCELIADKIHVHPAMYKIIAAVKGCDRIILITDAIRASCMKEGTYELGGQNVSVKHGAARLEDGTLAGSVLCLDQAIRNFREHTGLSLPEVIRMVSLNPASLIGLDKEIGSLEVGKRSDFTIFKENIDIMTTIIAGELYFTKT